MNRANRLIAVIVAAVLLFTALIGVFAPVFYAAEEAVAVSPSTGDNSILGPMLIVLGVSSALIIVLVIVLVLRRKK